MIRKRLLLILLVFLAFTAMGQFGGCQCPVIPMLSFEYEIPYFTANNIDLTNLNNVDRIALFCFVEVEYYDSQNNLLQNNTERRYLARLVKNIPGEQVFEQYPNPAAISNFIKDAMQLNIPSNAVKAKIKFHVGAHYLLNDLTNDHWDDDDGIEAYARDFYLGFNKITGWIKAEEDNEGVHTAIAEIMSDGTLHGKFIGGDEYDIDQGYVTFSAEVPLR